MDDISNVFLIVHEPIHRSYVMPETEPLTWQFWRKRRYIVVMMAFFGFCNVYSLRVNLSVGIVAMTEMRPVTYENGTTGHVSVSRSKPNRTSVIGICICFFVIRSNISIGTHVSKG